MKDTVFEGSWLATSSGGMWSIDAPDARDVHLVDLAVGLSRTCRYNGQIREDADFYSVSEHSVLMTGWAWENGFIATRSEALAFLFHDASEAFLGDVATPLKAMLPGFREIEDRSQAVIMEALGVSGDVATRLQTDIKRVDTRIRLDERAALILEPAMSAGREALWRLEPDLEPLGVCPEGLSPPEAFAAFGSTCLWALSDLPDDIGPVRCLDEGREAFASRGHVAVAPGLARNAAFDMEP